jgi:iron complex outermembrane receptor protein
MKRLQSGLVTSGAMIALQLLLSTSALAQAAASDAVDPAADPATDPADPAGQTRSVEGAEERDILVTGSRLPSGFTTPTPVTAVSSDQLRSVGPNLLSDALIQLPAFRNSASARTQAGSTLRENGASFLNLRGLSPQRTLVLVNGRRTVTSGTLGAVDVNTIPQAVVDRVEIVTGGASAAYGSDAVAGVVNFVLNNRLDGVRASVQAGVSGYGDAGSQSVSLAGGTSFAGGAGHIVASVEYFRQEEVGFQNGRDWFQDAWGIVTNGAQRVIARPIVWSNMSVGGLITSGALANNQFLPGGGLTPFSYGQFRNSNFMIGGDGPIHDLPLMSGTERGAGFLRAEFAPASGLTLYAEGAVAQSTIEVHLQYPFTNAASAFQIFSDNAYLPSTARASLLAAGQTSFRMGRYNSDFGSTRGYARSRTARLTAGLDWEFANNWTLSAYYMHGVNKFRVRTANAPVLRRLYAAADAVRDPAGNIVCRSTLAGFDQGCVPINLFGQGAPSQAALDYILDTSEANLTLEEDVVSASVAGELFRLPGGAVQVAAGAEYRRESAVQVVDGLSAYVNTAEGLRGFPAGLVGVPGSFNLGNFAPLSGGYNVKEAFVEIEAPLLAEMPFFHSLTVNAAARLIDYSTVGSVATWKIGVSWNPVEDFRLRATRSRDIRAGNVTELFQSPSRISVFPIVGGATREGRQIRSGNAALNPETADTLTAGIVYRPSWLPRLGLSVDFYDIKIGGAIAQLTAQQTIDQCAAGSTEICTLISTDAAGILIIRTPTLNLARVQTRGVDVELRYAARLGRGELRIRGLLNYLDELKTEVPGSPAIDRAGDIGIQASPRWSASLLLSYEDERFGLDIQERYIGPGRIDVTLADVVPTNHVPAVFYTDVTGRIRIGEGRYELFATVNNLFNRTPPIVPTNPTSTFRSTQFALYDVVGRYMTVGARLRF